MENKIGCEMRVNENDEGLQDSAPKKQVLTREVAVSYQAKIDVVLLHSVPC